LSNLVASGNFTLLSKYSKVFYRDPVTLWKTPEVQEAKSRFFEQYAKNSPKWVKEWKRKLIKIALDNV